MALRKPLFLVVLLTTLASGYSAQSTAPSTPSPPVDPQKASEDVESIDTTIRKQVDEVNVIFTVTDKRGKFVKNLGKDDFAIRDDKKPPQAVVGFSTQTDLPLRVGLLIDVSNSVRDRFRFEQEAAIQFLNQVIRPNSDKAFVLGFDTISEVTADFTSDAAELARGVAQLKPGGGTALYDALYYACRDKLMKIRENGPVRRAVILISDGEDNQSRVTRDESIEMAQRAEVILYAISTNTSGMQSRGDKVLQMMAEQTGGRVFFPFKIEDMADAFTDIDEELRSQYALSYKPADFQPDGRFRTIELAVVNNKKLRVRARKGYYAAVR
jgi:Ca-activated chloride channel homolog